MRILILLYFCFPLVCNSQQVVLNNPKVPHPVVFKGLDKTVVVFEKIDTLLSEIPSQHNPLTDEISFILKPSKSKDREIVLKSVSNSVSNSDQTLVKSSNDVTLKQGSKPILTYVSGIKDVPNNVSPLFKKSGFIHPLYSPNGTVLTRIQPKDHYHHYGIWGPWTKTSIKGEHIDFWNLNDSLGTVLFEKYEDYQVGNVYSGFTAKQHHYNFKAEPDEKLAIEESLSIRSWNIGEKYLIDYTSHFTTPLVSGVLFEAYRYGGGIGFRATENWDTANSSVLTSEGKTRLNADGTNARWCIIKGDSKIAGQQSGILFMSHPDNQSHPEPMRVWPADQYKGKSNVFFEFCPIRHQEWSIEKGKKYQLKYRMLVFDGDLSIEEAEAYWQAFANPTIIDIK